MLRYHKLWHFVVIHPYPYAKTRTTAGHATPERSSNAGVHAFFFLSLHVMLINLSTSSINGVPSGEVVSFGRYQFDEPTVMFPNIWR